MINKLQQLRSTALAALLDQLVHRFVASARTPFFAQGWGCPRTIAGCIQEKYRPSNTQASSAYEWTSSVIPVDPVAKLLRTSAGTRAVRRYTARGTSRLHALPSACASYGVEVIAPSAEAITNSVFNDSHAMAAHSGGSHILKRVGHSLRLAQAQLPFRRGGESSEVAQGAAAVAVPRGSSELGASGEAPRRSIPCVIALPATGDHSARLRRVLFADALAGAGIACALPTLPFTGDRRPSDQQRSSLRYVSDLFLMGAATTVEVLDLIAELRNNFGYGPFVVMGTSLGGFMASVAASMSPDDDVAAVPIVSPCHPSTVYAQGQFAQGVAFDALSKDARTEVFTAAGLPAQRAVALVRQAQGSPAGAQAALKEMLDQEGSLMSYPSPKASHACIQVLAKHDSYVSDYAGAELHDHWQGSRVRFLPSGHISAMLYREELLAAVHDAVARLERGSSV